MVNFPQFCLKNLEFFLNFKNCKKKKKKKKKSIKTLEVLKSNIGYFISKRYFYYFEAFRGTFVTLAVYGYFRYFLALIVYFSHFGWSNCVNRVQKHMSIMQPDGDPKSDRWDW